MPHRPFPIVISGPHGDKTGHAMRRRRGQGSAGCGFWRHRFRGKRRAQAACPAAGSKRQFVRARRRSAVAGDRDPVMGIAQGSRPWECAKAPGYGRILARRDVFGMKIRSGSQLKSWAAVRGSAGSTRACAPADRGMRRPATRQAATRDGSSAGSRAAANIRGNAGRTEQKGRSASRPRQAPMNPAALQGRPPATRASPRAGQPADSRAPRNRQPCRYRLSCASTGSPRFTDTAIPCGAAYSVIRLRDNSK